MRGARDDHFFPIEGFTIFREEEFPAAWRVGLGERLHELKRAFLHAVGYGDVDSLGRIPASGGFEADIAEVLRVIERLGVEFGEPLTRIGDLDVVQAVAIDLFGEWLAVAHEPNDELAPRCNPRVDGGSLGVGGLTGRLEDKPDFWMRLAARVNLARPQGQAVGLRLRVSEFQRGLGRGRETREG